MSGGIPVEDSCIKAFHELKSKRNVNTVIYRLSDNLETVVPDFKGNLTHDELLKALPAAETRFVVYDLVFATADGTRKEKIVLISWCPESVKVEQKIAHSTTCSKVHNLLDGVQVYVQATDLTDVEYDELVSRTS
ncbi:actin depolymerization factor/cofilin-like domain-containing protein [Streptomyces sp. NBC_01707]|uniref:actin-binding ADF family protein n=1 Tax=unclassified Streptomyces TaxID=2593676 RepID=UPI0029BC89D5|nr:MULTISPECIES: actin depolymerization factor/cofilin-like domain-containing protein [unclassified Streptomyces]MDX3771392.1 actin depolymerization factor/cofilin-like domain-containing protein [Streptomyces sp. AK08-01B]MDX3820889.1 actin depolymerization factor/cofilin-like domain-containing protein [Streptomyces sp. AK08-01A]